MAPGRTRDERKEWQWRHCIDEWRASGRSVRAFCDRRGLATASFYAWRRTLERRAAEKVALVPVQVVADTPPASASALEVVLANGRTVRVAPGFDAATSCLTAGEQHGGPRRRPRRHLRPIAPPLRPGRFPDLGPCIPVIWPPTARCDRPSSDPMGRTGTQMLRLRKAWCFGRSLVDSRGGRLYDEAVCRGQRTEGTDE